jgi:predicted ATPase
MDGKQTAENLVKQATFSTGEGIKAFLKQVITCLRNDTREGKNRPIPIYDQLLKGKKLEALLGCVFELQYLEPSHTLRWANKEISELSPGERGTLLLVFYLLIDQSDIPLIIDQPEENLDNQTVYDVLVPSIKEAKVRRQIIMVTHNPNLAVVCDADQIIYASLDKEKGNRVTYQHGSIENIVVNQKLVDILEGTWPAFDNRERKYIRSTAHTS